MQATELSYHNVIPLYRLYGVCQSSVISLPLLDLDITPKSANMQFDR